MKFEHNFADHQHCLKCGKGEWEPDADDCVISHEEYERYVQWKIAWRKRAEEATKKLRDSVGA